MSVTELLFKIDNVRVKKPSEIEKIWPHFDQQLNEHQTTHFRCQFVISDVGVHNFMYHHLR